MLKDDIISVRRRSVLLDNTTLFTCIPLHHSSQSYQWADKWWADDLVDWGMSNLVEALILHDAVYVDGDSRY
jgi:hypothetical protein